MSIESPKNWWQPIGKTEKLWLFLAIFWCAIMMFMMIYGHTRDHNMSQESYRTTPEKFRAVVEGFTEKYRAKDANGKPMSIAIKKLGGQDQSIPVVDARDIPETPANYPNGTRRSKGADVFLLATNWKFTPALILKKGKTYRIHMSSDNYQHGFSLLPMNLNYQVLPNFDLVLTITPKEVSKSEEGFRIICNEYCGSPSSEEGHHSMSGRIIVKE
ncbi:MAG: cytochrome C oxidase subunit II [Spirochaetota bacterium]|nr:cytochrome C oxidase subunit II [Spirochaetota bacterium]